MAGQSSYVKKTVPRKPEVGLCAPGKKQHEEFQQSTQLLPTGDFFTYIQAPDILYVAQKVERQATGSADATIVCAGILSQ